MKLYLTSKSHPLLVLLSDFISTIILWAIILTVDIDNTLSLILLSPLYLWPLYSGMLVDWIVKIRNG